MKKEIFSFLLGLLTFTIQAQIGKVGINTTTPAAMLHVKDSSVVFTGINPPPNTPGNPPISGVGTRMMWYPDKAAFRAGYVLTTSWNKDSIGLYSAAMGFNTKAKGITSIAMGESTSAIGQGSTAMGFGTRAINLGSMAMGENTLASGEGSTSMGAFTSAVGKNSIATGLQTIASGFYSISM